MNPIILKIKNENKALAEDIKQLKLRRKPSEAERLGKYEVTSETGKEIFKRSWWSVDSLSWEFRHRHIAYCELRGRKREEIEKPADDNLPREDKIEKYKSDWCAALKEVEDENVCVNS